MDDSTAHEEVGPPTAQCPIPDRVDPRATFGLPTAVAPIRKLLNSKASSYKEEDLVDGGVQATRSSRKRETILKTDSGSIRGDMLYQNVKSNYQDIRGGKTTKQDLQSDNLPFQQGMPLERTEEVPKVEDPSREVLMIHEDEAFECNENDLMEQVDLFDYNLSDYDEFLLDNDIGAVSEETEVAVEYGSPLIPPGLTVTVEVDNGENDTRREHRRIKNMKRSIRRHRQIQLCQNSCGDSYDFSNSDLRNIINIGCDVRNVIISRKREREEIEAYSPMSNYRIPHTFKTQVDSTPREQWPKKEKATQTSFKKALHEQCKLHPKSKHSMFACRTLHKALGAPPLDSK